jgi:hypothetical protein
MIIYQLMTDGDMGLSHINRAVPFFEHDIVGAQRTFESISPPRVIKTHLPYDKTPKGHGRYLYVMRHGLDVAVSYYHHYRRCHRYAGSIADFMELFLSDNLLYGSWFQHVNGWIANPDQLNLMVIRYEDLQAMRETCVRRIADMCGLSIGAQKLQQVMDRSSFDFMRQHEAKFDIKGPIIESPNDHFVRNGSIGEWRSCVAEEFTSRYRDRMVERLKDPIFNPYRL